MPNARVQITAEFCIRLRQSEPLSALYALVGRGIRCRANWPNFCVLLFILLFMGCSKAPLEKLRTTPGCPFSEADKQVQLGDRKTGSTYYGPIHKEMWLDSNGREYDPEVEANKVFDYLKETGDIEKVNEALKNQTCAPWMRIVSINPLVVIQIPCQHKRWKPDDGNSAHGTRLALELSFTPDKQMYFDEPMEWFSPTLKQPPTLIKFSDQGKAEIKLKKGKLVLSREGEWCNVTRK